MIIAITGANGFIGHHLVNRFAELGYDVRPVIRRDYEGGRSILSSRFRGADVVVHAAGATRAVSIAQLRDANVGLTRQTLAAAKGADVGRVVFISSQAAAGPATSLEAPVDEGAEPKPIEAYGLSKLDAERLLHSVDGLSWAIVRPSAVYGPGDRDFLAMFRLARRGWAIHPGNREQWVSIVHVDDVANAVVKAATERAAHAGTFFVANDDPIQWQQLFRECSSALSVRLKLDVEVPRALVTMGARMGDVVARITGRAGLLTTTKVVLSRPKYWICANARARRDLNWSPSVSLHDGLRATHEWYRSRGWL